MRHGENHALAYFFGSNDYSWIKESQIIDWYKPEMADNIKKKSKSLEQAFKVK